MLANTIPVASGAPRSNRPGVVTANGNNRTSGTQNLVLAANEKRQLDNAGQQFYVVLATGKVKIKPNPGSYNTYTQGTGEIVPPDASFRGLEIHNPNTFPIVVSLFVGFGAYIDNRAILYDPLVNSIVYPTFPVNGAANFVNITDRSGTAFTDINGTDWLALTRTAIYVTNNDLALTYLVNNAAGTKTALGVLPTTNVVLPWNGDFRIADAALLQIYVSEVYQAILPGSF